ncbi:MAG: hypothetical protein K1X89_15250, partial [Myxococcaceae bacterium]|nr:hypothetical protein [Myxococcaceae bacterium]
GGTASGGGSGSSGGGSAASGGGTASSGGGAAGGGSGFTDGGVSLAMTFFVTSKGMGSGGDLRGDAGTGLEGADRFCVSLAGAVSPVLGAKNWKAYLSTTAVTARSRVGQGPWVNAKGVQIAANVNQLHDDVGTNTLSYDNALDETGAKVPTGGATGTNVHDILTGSTLDGGLSVGANCNDWTSSTGANSVRVGHCNRAGGGQFPTSWNSAHTLASCTEQGVKSGGGRGSFYCFVSN